MTLPNFKDYLEKEFIEALLEERGFRNPRLIEKLIKSIEFACLLREDLPDSVIKGGLAALLNLEDDFLHRISIDVDLVTSRTRNEVIGIIEKFAVKHGISDNIHLHIPKKSMKRLPLLTYYVKYESSFGEEEDMKIEIFHDNNLNAQKQKIKSSGKIMGFEIGFPVAVYGAPALIGDKLTTMAFGTIGIPPKRRADVTKHVYDVASLLKTWSDNIPISEIINSFETAARDEISYSDNIYKFKDVLNDLVKFPDELIDNQFKLHPAHEGRFNTFVTDMLGKQKYLKSSYIADVLLINAIITLLIKKFNGVEPDVVTEFAGKLMVGLYNMSKMDINEKNDIRKVILNKHDKSSKARTAMNVMPSEHVYLYDQALEITKL